MLADVRLERAERAFVRRLAAVLHVDQAVADDIVKVIRIKNYA